MGGIFNSLFFQDNVKLTPNLSINAGLRWEYRRPAIDKTQQLRNPGDDRLLSSAARATPPAGDGSARTAVNDSFCANAADNYFDQ